MNVTSHHSATVLARMTINILTELIPIPCTEHEKLNRLRSLLIEIQAAWFDNLFDSGLTFSTPEIWGKMLGAVCLLERRDNPSAKGIDLKAIASDYDLLEQIFISKRWRYDEEGDQVLLDADGFKGCDLVRVHHFSAIAILKEVEVYRANRKLEEVLKTAETQKSYIFAEPNTDSDRTIEQRVVDSYPDNGDTELWKVNNARREMHMSLLWRTPEGILIPEGYESAAEYEKSLGLESYPDEDLVAELLNKGYIVEDPKTQIIDEDGDTPN